MASVPSVALIALTPGLVRTVAKQSRGAGIFESLLRTHGLIICALQVDHDAHPVLFLQSVPAVRKLHESLSRTRSRA